jgi:cation-transporting ATPase I
MSAAIRAADIGVGINARGSAAARNAADIVLTDDDLTVLIDAVGEGRALWHSVADAIAILIGGNAGEVAFGLLGTLLSGRAPLSTRQMLMVNLFTDLFPSMAVAVTEKEEEVDLAHVEEAAVVLGDPLLRQIRHRALTTCLGAVTAWLIGRFTPGTARRSSTMALCGVVGTQLVQTLLDRRDSRLVQITSLGSAVALVAVVQTPVVSRAFGCTPLGPGDRGGGRPGRAGRRRGRSGRGQTERWYWSGTRISPPSSRAACRAQDGLRSSSRPSSTTSASPFSRIFWACAASVIRPTAPTGSGVSVFTRAANGTW